jgi:hypothetical protein
MLHVAYWQNDTGEYCQKGWSLAVAHPDLRSGQKKLELKHAAFAIVQ